jgi:HK97 family phage major capsid protein/HK97 family phage prohead protease
MSKKPLGPQYRSVEIQLDAERASDDGRVAIAISSEAPYRRWYGVEILDHGKGSVDLGFFRNGAPVLVGHDTSDQVGVLEDVRLTEDRVLRGMIRFGSSARAREIAQDVRDGIRKHISVGYQVLRMKKESEADGVVTYRVDRWKPIETSIVPVPADETVGVGREADTAALPVDVEPVAGDKPEEERAMPEQAAAPAPAPVSVQVQDLSDVKSDIAAVRATAAEILKRQEAALQPNDAAPDIWEQMSEAEKKRYSVGRATRAVLAGNWRDAGLELEVSNALEKTHTGRQAGNDKGFLIPLTMTVHERALVAGTTSLGGATVFTQEMPLIELLRNRAVSLMAGAQFMTGLTGGPIGFPRQITAGGAGARAENPGSDLADTDSTYELMTLSPKLIQRSTAFSRQFAVQTSLDAEQHIRNDLAAVLALALDLQAIQGGGTNEQIGIIANTNIASVTLGANGAQITLAALCGMEQSIATANADGTALAFVTNPGQRARGRQVQYFSGTNGIPLWETAGGADQLYGGRVLGYPGFVSNQIASNLTKGTSTTICSAWLFGNWRELLIPIWGNAAEVVFDPYTKKKQALLELTAYLMGDSGVRHVGSFVKVIDALA